MNFESKRFTTWADETSWIKVDVDNRLSYIAGEFNTETLKRYQTIKLSHTK